MRVTIAAFVCVVALVRADSVSAYAGPADNSRAVAASICGEPTVLVEIVLPTAAIGDSPRDSPRDSLRDSARDSLRDSARDSLRNTAREATDEGGTLWCVSPDDPRCSPLDSGSQNGVSLGNAKLGVAASYDIDVFAPRALAAIGGETGYLGSARDGVLGQLERPPN